VIYGLLDGPTLTGAYRLDVTPGPTLTVDVEARLFLRSVPEKLGIAPITSMFLFGEDHPARFNDYRPEVHDADGLLMQHSDDSLEWRPLRNPPRLAVSRFAMERPKGFGLMQRDRSFASYEDLETEMNIRPSVWVRLHGDWGKGAVELLEIASDDEGVDNIGAYWVQTDREYQPGEEIALSYSLDFTQDPRPVGREKMAFVQTRWLISDGSEGGSVVRTAASEDGQPVARFLIDTSDGSALPNGTIVKPDVTVNKGELIGEPIVQYNRFADSYRLFFDVQRLGEEPVELRATLREDDGSPHSETWVYRWE
jgi:glucans biosynthesis protein